MDDETALQAVLDAARRIPVGKVMSYAQVGDEAGGISPRMTGWAMSNAVDGNGDVPWQRVVGSDGYLRIGRRSPELQAVQRRLLESEGVTFLANGYVDMSRHQVGFVEPVQGAMEI